MDHNKLWKALKEMGMQTILPASREICMQVKNWMEQLELDMEQQTGSRSEKEYVKAVYCHPAYLTYMESILNARLDDSQAGIKIAGRNINNLKYADNTTSTQNLVENSVSGTAPQPIR